MVLSKCPGCGASVATPPPGLQRITVPCQYCHTAINIDPIAPPQQRAPIQISISPDVLDHNRVFANQMRARAMEQSAAAVRTNSRLGCIITAVCLLPALIPLIFVFGGSFKNLKMRFQSNPFPLVCDVNEELTIDGKKATGKEPLIVARANCKLHIKNSKLSGPWIVKAEANAEIEIVDSTLEGTQGVIDAGQNGHMNISNSTLSCKNAPAIVGDANPVLNLSSDSKIKSDDDAVQFEANAEVSVDKSTIESSDAIALAGGVNLKLKVIDGGKIKGKTYGVKAKSNPVITVNGSTVESHGTAIFGDSSTEITAKNGTIKGKKFAFDLGSGAHVELHKSDVSGERHMDTGGTVDED